MNQFIYQLAFGWFPYLAVTVMVVGSILRFDRDQYGWRSQSSQFLRRRQMRWGSNLMHLGILVLLGGHLVGLMTPIAVFDALGVSHGFKQLMALVVGGLAGVAAWIGTTLLLHRRLFDPRIRRSSSFGDIAVLVLLWMQITLGVATAWWTVEHLDGSEMVLFMGWAQGLATLDPDAADLIIDSALVYKLHIILGLVLFMITPFTRLVHVFSAPIWFLFRPGWHLVLNRNPRRKPETSPTRGQPASGFGGPAVERAASDSGQGGV